MNANLRTPKVEDSGLIHGLRRTLDRSHEQLLEAAREKWDRDFAGTDPSDACISVRIRSGDLDRRSLSMPGPCAKPDPQLLSGSR